MRIYEYVDQHGLDRARDIWLDAIRESVAPRPSLQLDPSHAALVIIDMQRYFADPLGRCYLPAAGAMVPRLAALARAWREAKRPVVLTRHGHQGEDDLGMLGRFFSDYIRIREPDWEIIEALGPKREDIIIDKSTYDAFLGTELQSQLEQQAVSQVVITGVLTHMCCETTARSAFCRGFEVYLPVDGVASSVEALHLGSLVSLSDALAIPTSVQEVGELCTKS